MGRPHKRKALVIREPQGLGSSPLRCKETKGGSNRGAIAWDYVCVENPPPPRYGTDAPPCYAACLERRQRDALAPSPTPAHGHERSRPCPPWTMVFSTAAARLNRLNVFQIQGFASRTAGPAE